jgi:hypothetical protein
MEFAGRDISQKNPEEESAHQQMNPHHGNATETNEHYQTTSMKIHPGNQMDEKLELTVSHEKEAAAWTKLADGSPSDRNRCLDDENHLHDGKNYLDDDKYPLSDHSPHPLRFHDRDSLVVPYPFRLHDRLVYANQRMDGIAAGGVSIHGPLHDPVPPCSHLQDGTEFHPANDGIAVVVFAVSQLPNDPDPGH